MIFTSRSFAIGRAHFQIAGGLRTFWILGVAYVAVAAALLGILFYNEPPPMPPHMASALYAFIMVIEAFVLVLFGSIRIGSTIRLDLMTNMIESHRMMPVASWRAVFGYLFGSTAHVLLITALNILLLVWISHEAGLTFSDFVISQMVLAFFTLFVWTFSAMGSMMMRQLMPLMVVGSVFGSIGMAFLRSFGILPGIMVLGSPFFGETIFTATAGMFSIRNMYPWALSAQLALAVLFFFGACRRYRGSFASTFNILQALGLGAVWGVLSAVSIANWAEFNPIAMMRREQPMQSQQIVASLTIGALLAIIPLHALVALQGRRKLPWMLTPAVVLGAALISLLSAAALASTKVSVENRPYPIGGLLGITFLVLLAHTLTIYFSFRATRNMSGMANGSLVCVLLFGIWILPFIAELVRWMVLPNTLQGDSEFSILGTLSPLGLLINQWSAAVPMTWIVGLAFQWGAVFGVWRLSERLNRHENKGGFPVVMPAS